MGKRHRVHIYNIPQIIAFIIAEYYDYTVPGSVQEDQNGFISYDCYFDSLFRVFMLKVELFIYNIKNKTKIKAKIVKKSQ